MALWLRFERLTTSSLRRADRATAGAYGRRQRDRKSGSDP
jgi:hypothetical protein